MKLLINAHLPPSLCAVLERHVREKIPDPFFSTPASIHVAIGPGTNRVRSSMRKRSKGSVISLSPFFHAWVPQHTVPMHEKLEHFIGSTSPAK